MAAAAGTLRPAPADDRGALVPAGVILGSVGLLGLAVLGGSSLLMIVAPMALIAIVVAAGHRTLFRWPALVGGVLLVIFLVPIKRYSLPSALPFNLEPYRLLIALVAMGWIASLLVDARVRLRAGGLEGPMALFAFVALVSVSVNGARIQALGVSTVVVKSLTFFASFLVLFYIIVSVLRRRAELDGAIRLAVAAGAVVALSALVESRTAFNVFNQLERVFPLLHFNDPALAAGLDAEYLGRSGRMRVYASAAHPIELSAVLVMLAPLALYLFTLTRRKLWVGAGGVLILGALATVSRTGVVMLVVMGVVALWLRPRQTRRAWPLLVPALVVVFFALPNTLGSLYASFFPKGGLLAQQQEQVDGNHLGADGRLSDIGPSLAEFSKTPLVGQGFGSRVTDAASSAALGIKRARILDDQWLGSLLETGLLGVIALLWLFVRSIRRLSRLARSDTGPDGALATALVASILSFAIGMLTFDTLGFVQVTILLFVLLAFGAVLLNVRRDAAEAA